MNPDKDWGYNPGKDLLEGVNRAIADRQGKASPVLLSALNSKIADDMKIITVPGFHLVQNALANIADKMPEWFPKGINGIYAVSNPELFAGFNQETGAFYISTSDEMVSGFKPAHELITALQKIQSGELLTFNNEYAVETLWHELWHQRTHQAQIPIGKDRLILESFVQFTSRHSYHELMIALGRPAKYQEQIIRQGYAYQYEVSNLRILLKEIDIDEVAMFGTMSRLLLENKEGAQLINAVTEQLSNESGRDQNKIKRALKLLTKPSGFPEKIRNLLDY